MSDKSQPTSNRQEAVRIPGMWSKLNHLEFREFWWAVLDAWETRRRFRWWSTGVALVLIFGLVSWLWIYPWWARRNAVRMARQWLDASRPAYAAEIVRQALVADPNRPELWSLAAELAGRAGQRPMAARYARQAYLTGREDHQLALVWASAALQADLNDEAREALSELPLEEKAGSAFAQRLLGELARRDNQRDEAVRRFGLALKIDGGGGANLLPLGLCLLSSPVEAERKHGKELLTGLAADPQWGPAAVRALLADALRRGDRSAMVTWAETLRAGPRFEIGDMPNYLGALKNSTPEKYRRAVEQLQRDHLASPESAAQLVGWLNEIGDSAGALAWMTTLPAAAVGRPPLAVAKAEALRGSGDWAGLHAWTQETDWGPEANFLRWAYAVRAARALGDEVGAKESWQALRENARTNTAHALFAGTNLYAWGLGEEAEELWWLAAEAGNNLSADALGTLVRYYQVRRDAEGQFRAFNRLYQLHPRDDAVANNLAFFAALTGNRDQLAEQLARSNLRRHAADSTYHATLAFVLVTKGRAAEAMKLLEPWKNEVGKSDAVTFAYGLAMATAGEKARAREILDRLDPATLTLREIDVIRSALGD